jgi:hypothetical protein
MKLADIMRDLADLMDQQQGSEEATLGPDNMPGHSSAEVELDNEPVMVPPLQQKHELLKKVAGVPNAYDDAESAQDTGHIDRMKKMAGIVIAGDENEVN